MSSLEIDDLLLRLRDEARIELGRDATRIQIAVRLAEKVGQVLDRVSASANYLIG